MPPVAGGMVAERRVRNRSPFRAAESGGHRIAALVAVAR